MAKAAEVHYNTVKYWEAREEIRPQEYGVRQIRGALEAADIIFIWQPGPGVAFVDRTHLRTRRRAR